jgi:hypothetical protein
MWPRQRNDPSQAGLEKAGIRAGVLKTGQAREDWKQIRERRLE